MRFTVLFSLSGAALAGALQGAQTAQAFPQQLTANFVKDVKALQELTKHLQSQKIQDEMKSVNQEQLMESMQNLIPNMETLAQDAQDPEKLQEKLKKVGNALMDKLHEQAPGVADELQGMSKVMTKTMTDMTAMVDHLKKDPKMQEQLQEAVKKGEFDKIFDIMFKTDSAEENSDLTETINQMRDSMKQTAGNSLQIVEFLQNMQKEGDVFEKCEKGQDQESCMKKQMNKFVNKITEWAMTKGEEFGVKPEDIEKLKAAMFNMANDVKEEQQEKQRMDVDEDRDVEDEVEKGIRAGTTMKTGLTQKELEELQASNAEMLESSTVI
jgi:hypothetical protein